MARNVDLVGVRFTRLTVVSRAGSIRGNSTWNCICDCGGVATVRRDYLRSGGKKSCGCLMLEALAGGRAANKKYHRPGEALFMRYVQRSKRKGIVFDLTETQFLEITAGACYYCGLAAMQKYGRGPKEYRYNGVDRVNPKLGYTLGNCVPCCKTCNFAKRNLTPEEWYSWVGRLAIFQMGKALKGADNAAIG